MSMFCRSLFVLWYFFLLAIVLSVLLRYTYSDYPFGIFKLFLPWVIWRHLCWLSWHISLVLCNLISFYKKRNLPYQCWQMSKSNYQCFYIYYSWFNQNMMSLNLKLANCHRNIYYRLFDLREWILHSNIASHRNDSMFIEDLVRWRHNGISLKQQYYVHIVTVTWS